MMYRFNGYPVDNIARVVVIVEFAVAVVLGLIAKLQILSMSHR